MRLSVHHWTAIQAVLVLVLTLLAMTVGYAVAIIGVIVLLVIVMQLRAESRDKAEAEREAEESRKAFQRMFDEQRELHQRTLDAVLAATPPRGVKVTASGEGSARSGGEAVPAVVGTGSFSDETRALSREIRKWLQSRQDITVMQDARPGKPMGIRESLNAYERMRDQECFDFRSRYIPRVRGILNRARTEFGYVDDALEGLATVARDRNGMQAIATRLDDLAASMEPQQAT